MKRIKEYIFIIIINKNKTKMKDVIDGYVIDPHNPKQ
jgi:hypothetical protein